MRPVLTTDSEFAQLVKFQPVLMLDKTAVGPAFVDSIVSRSPGLITSKQGHKHLPLELWSLILDFADRIPHERYRGHKNKHGYSLVVPQSLETDAHGGRTLVCKKIRRWQQFGQLKENIYADCYDVYLARSHLQMQAVKNPFHDLRACDGAIVKIPAVYLEPRIKMLFVELAVPDVIWGPEQGDCGFCHGSRTMDLGTDGREPAESPAESFFDENMGMFGDVRMLCPLCVGERYTLESLNMHDGWDGKPLLTPEKYDEWEKELLVELGLEG
ncbi:hypothetical protein ACHAPT_013559 [Fusarium lateritium]